MTPVIEEVREGAGNRVPSTNPECPRCGLTFQRKRKNQRYCRKSCQKAATHNTSRGSQKIADNSTVRRTSEVQRRRAWLLNFELYSKPPMDRPAFMEKILSAARNHDRHLHRILSDRRPYLQFDTDDWGRPNLTRTLDDYCKRTRNGTRLWQVIAPDWRDDAVSIHPLVLYKDIWTDPGSGPDGPRPTYAQRDAAEFFRQVRAISKPELEGIAQANPPSCPIKVNSERTFRVA